MSKLNPPIELLPLFDSETGKVHNDTEKVIDQIIDRVNKIIRYLNIDSE